MSNFLINKLIMGVIELIIFFGVRIICLYYLKLLLQLS